LYGIIVKHNVKLLESKFEEIIQGFIDHRVGTSLSFFSDELNLELYQNLVSFFDNNKFHAASIGKDEHFSHNLYIRNDDIYWLDHSNENLIESKFLDLMELFIEHLNRTCYLGITSSEFHYTRYAKGSFYRKHIDAFLNNDSRAYSIIIYLNPCWKIGDGGELKIYNDSTYELIEPRNNTLVFFDSKTMLHEVLETHVPRLSITGWLKR